MREPIHGAASQAVKGLLSASGWAASHPDLARLKVRTALNSLFAAESAAVVSRLLVQESGSYQLAF